MPHMRPGPDGRVQPEQRRPGQRSDDRDVEQAVVELGVGTDPHAAPYDGVLPTGRAPASQPHPPAAPPAVSGPPSQVPTTTTAWVKLPPCRPSPTSLSSRASVQVPTTTTAWVKLRGGGRRPAAGTPAARPGWRARSGVVRAASAG